MGDEATSALDSENEKQIQEALDAMVKQMGSTVSVVIIAHRLSTIMGCDKILVINDGKVAEQGTHAELMLNDQIYASLVKRQMAKKTETETMAVEPDGGAKSGGKSKGGAGKWSYGASAKGTGFDDRVGE